MAPSCENVNARMMELLYGELSGEERTAIEGHVAGCARCRAELEGFQNTRAVARRALDEAPPARAHDALLRAAAAAVQPAAAKSAAPARASLWDWLRARWTFPTLATVGAVAVVVLASRIFLEPEKTYQRGRQGLRAPAPELAPVTPPAGPSEAPAGVAANAAPAAAPAGAATNEAPAAQAPAGRTRLDEKQAAPAETGSAAAGKAAAAPAKDWFFRKAKPESKREAPAHATAAAPKKPAQANLDELMEGASSSSGGERAHRVHPTSAKSKADLNDLFGAPSDANDGTRFAPPPPPRAPGKHEISDNPLEEGVGGRDENQPERPAGARGFAAGPPAAKPAPAVHAAKKTSSQKGDAARAGGGAPAAPAPPPATAAPSPVAPGAAQALKVEEEEDAAEATDDRAPSDKSRASEAKLRKQAVESPVARADRLFAQGRWAEAAAAYRQLLRADPRNADAARWRERLAATEAELRPPRTAPAAAEPER